jgi:hypothetical protein
MITNERTALVSPPKRGIGRLKNKHKAAKRLPSTLTRQVMPVLIQQLPVDLVASKLRFVDRDTRQLTLDHLRSYIHTNKIDFHVRVTARPDQLKWIDNEHQGVATNGRALTSVQSYTLVRDHAPDHMDLFPAHMAVVFRPEKKHHEAKVALKKLADVQVQVEMTSRENPLIRATRSLKLKMNLAKGIMRTAMRQPATLPMAGRLHGDMIYNGVAEFSVRIYDDSVHGTDQKLYCVDEVRVSEMVLYGMLTAVGRDIQEAAAGLSLADPQDEWQEYGDDDDMYGDEDGDDGSEGYQRGSASDAGLMDEKMFQLELMQQFIAKRR